ncbi:hypothetical protein [Anaerovorax sp. IOR16]|uniref:hypothetical protein n=1 Tax=Anaerovorax sp. IOR16 TaxID=2773458 RepID=UPI0019CFDF4E|nr:hypothetical protein [Anaerovorax sp. IOR16]
MAYIPIENQESASSVRGKINSLPVAENIILSSEVQTLYETDNMNEILKTLKITTDLKSRVITGSYTGDGATTRLINLSVTPKAVLVVSNEGKMFYPSGSEFHIVGGLATTNSPCMFGVNYPTAIKIVTNGFEVYNDYKMDGSYSYRADTNINNIIFNYIAVF